jgi:hypothetical protein
MAVGRHNCSSEQLFSREQQPNCTAKKKRGESLLSHGKRCLPPTHPWLDFLEYAKYRISSHQYGLTLKIGKRNEDATMGHLQHIHLAEDEDLRTCRYL